MIDHNGPFAKAMHDIICDKLFNNRGDNSKDTFSLLPANMRKKYAEIVEEFEKQRNKILDQAVREPKTECFNFYRTGIDQKLIILKWTIDNSFNYEISSLDHNQAIRVRRNDDLTIQDVINCMTVSSHLFAVCRAAKPDDHLEVSLRSTDIQNPNRELFLLVQIHLDKLDDFKYFISSFSR